MVKDMTKEEYKIFNDEMNRLRNIKWEGYGKTLKAVGINYLGSVAHSSKLYHSYIHKVSTYGIYLSSADGSGLNVCPQSSYCKENCLNGSGHRKAELLGGKNQITNARNTKTRLFFANREVFMRLLIHEVLREQRKAEARNHFFSVRLNCTSDINPESFVLNGKNVFQLFPEIMFYDYSKVANRIKVARKYENYHLTWSIDGSEKNLAIGLEYLKSGGHVAVVYGSETMPISWYGYETCDGDQTDYRPSDNKPVCMLKFKKTANNYKNGKFQLPNTAFIVTETNQNCRWAA